MSFSALLPVAEQMALTRPIEYRFKDTIAQYEKRALLARRVANLAGRTISFISLGTLALVGSPFLLPVAGILGITYLIVSRFQGREFLGLMATMPLTLLTGLVSGYAWVFAIKARASPVFSIAFLTLFIAYAIITGSLLCVKVISLLVKKHYVWKIQNLSNLVDQVKLMKSDPTYRPSERVLGQLKSWYHSFYAQPFVNGQITILSNDVEQQISQLRSMSA